MTGISDSSIPIKKTTLKTKTVTNFETSAVAFTALSLPFN